MSGGGTISVIPFPGGQVTPTLWSSYWSADIAEAHEMEHIWDFFDNFWLPRMELWENEVKDVGQNVYFDCNGAATVAEVEAPKVGPAGQWRTRLNELHNLADTANASVTEVAPLNVSNPMSHNVFLAIP